MVAIDRVQADPNGLTPAIVPKTPHQIEAESTIEKTKRASITLVAGIWKKNSIVNLDPANISAEGWAPSRTSDSNDFRHHEIWN